MELYSSFVPHLDNQTETEHPRPNRKPHPPRWLRSRSCEPISINQTDHFDNNMSEGQEGRAERIARYKEERRKQLAAQFEAKHNADESNKSARKDGGVSSSQSNAAGAGEGVRSTRASRLRAAAKSQDNLASPKSALSLSSDVSFRRRALVARTGNYRSAC